MIIRTNLNIVAEEYESRKVMGYQMQFLYKITSFVIYN